MKTSERKIERIYYNHSILCSYHDETDGVEILLTSTD